MKVIFVSFSDQHTGAFQIIGKNQKINRREWKNTRMKGKWASTDRILSSHLFFLHAYMLKFLAIGFLAQHAKILK